MDQFTKVLFPEASQADEGRIVYGNGNTFEGSWVQGKIDGNGVAKYENGITYKGQFRTSLHHGAGTLITDDGYSYIGSWVDGQRIGELRSHTVTEIHI